MRWDDGVGGKGSLVMFSYGFVGLNVGSMDVL